MTLEMPEQLLWISAAAASVMFLLWLLQLKTRDAGPVDIAWSVLLGLAAVFCGLTGEGDASRRLLIALMGGIWGLRLALHLLVRVLGGPEDGRYRMMREKFGARANAVFFAFFLAQAVSIVILSGPFLVAGASAPPGLRATDVAGLAVWVVGLLGESIADGQLKAFKRNPANTGKVCAQGLWRYSRHPNYFFEWLMWIGYALVASSIGNPWLIALAWSAPAIILLFVLKLSGIPPTEERAVRSKGDAYRAYQRTTSAFFPWFPRPDAGAKP